MLGAADVDTPAERRVLCASRRKKVGMQAGVKLAGVLSFAVCRSNPIIASIVVFNGVLFHGMTIVHGSPITCLKRFDIACNLALAMYVNCFTSWQPHTAVLTLVAVAVWQANNLLFRKNALVHVVGVQYPLCIALYRYT